MDCETSVNIIYKIKNSVNEMTLFNLADIEQAESYKMIQHVVSVTSPCHIYGI